MSQQSTHGTTIFTKIIERQIPAEEIVYEDEQCIAIRDINPQAPTHILVIAKDPIKGLSSTTDQHKELLGHMLCTVRKVAENEELEDGYRVVLNDSPQQVPHLHFHLIGGRQMKWPPG